MEDPTLMATTQLPRDLYHYLIKTPGIYAGKNGKLQSFTSTMDKFDERNGERKFCIYKKETYANMPMVGCDNWYHLDCLKLKDFPKVKKWCCKLCKSSKK